MTVDVRPPQAPPGPVGRGRPEFPNLRSRLLLGRAFERQFVIPPPPPAFLERLLAAYERRWLKIDTAAIPIDRPIFLLGLPRSGTTLLAQLLACHPGLGYITNTMHGFPGAFCAAHVLNRRLGLDLRGERYLGDSIEVESSSPNDGLVLWARWLGVDLYELDYERVRRRPEDLTEADAARVLDGIRRVLWCFGGAGKRFLNKNPALLCFLEAIAALFPGARVVHIVRDPRWCANSLVKLARLTRLQEDWLRSRGLLGPGPPPPLIPFPRLPGLLGYLRQWGAEDLRTAAHLWDEGVRRFETWKAQGTLPCLEVRHEDLVRRPREEMARLFEFCEIPPAFGIPRFDERLAGVGRLRHENQYGEFQLVEEICGATMARYGYARMAA